MRPLVLSLALASTFCVADPRTAADPGNVSKAGLVPDSDTAIAVAVAIWKPIYGAEEIQRQRPFRAKLFKGVWHVEGSLPPGVPGGVAEARIAKKDGRVLYVYHGK